MKRRIGRDQVKTDTAADPEAARHTVALLAVPLVHSSALYGGLDILRTAGMRFDAQGYSIAGEGVIEPIVVASTRDPVAGWHGVRIHPDASVDEMSSVDVVYIPSIGQPINAMPPFQQEVLDWVRAQYRRGATIAAACSGVWIPAAAGLLNGSKATSHWAYAREFQRSFPQVELQPNRSLVFGGHDHRIVTAGGGSLWTDLVLYLIARLVGQDAAVQSSKLYLIDWSRDSQLPYACLQARLQHNDALVRKAQSLISRDLIERDVVERARQETGLSSRTFQRRFAAATGTSAVQYVQQLRIEYAKELLEQAEWPTDDVASRVGYSDPSSFRRLFRRHVGVTPSEYRRRFGKRW